MPTRAAGRDNCDSQGKQAKSAVRQPTASSDAGHRDGGSGDCAMTIYLREIGPIPILRRDEEAALIRRTLAGDRVARERLILAYLRLVVKIARSFEGLGVPLLDLISEGNIGLMKGVDRFRAERGRSLAIYASFWIRQRIRLALANQSRTVRLPMNIHARVIQIRRVAMHLHGSLGRKPNDEDIGEAMGVPASRIRKWLDASLPMSSLDAPVNEDGDSAASLFLADSGTPAAPDSIMRAESLRSLDQCVSELDSRTRQILLCRFSLNGHGKRTLNQIGADLDLSRERIRQVQNTGLAKLRQKVEERGGGGWPLEHFQRITGRVSLNRNEQANRVMPSKQPTRGKPKLPTSVGNPAAAINRRRRRRIVRAVAGAVIGGVIAGPIGATVGAMAAAAQKRGPKARRPAGQPKSASQPKPATASGSGKTRAGKRRATSKPMKTTVNIYPPIP